jgi:hypothetical protein
MDTREQFLQMDEEELYKLVGSHAITIEAEAFPPAYQPDSTFTQDFRAIGEKIFNRLIKSFYALLCGDSPDDKDDRDKVILALGDGTILVSTLAGLFITNFGLAPAIATVVAALVLKRVLTPTYTEVCKFWGENLPQ